MIEIIKAAFMAGEVKTFLIQGEYLEILEAAYPVDVAMMDRSGAQLSTMRSAEASYFSRPGKYEVIQVTSSQAQTVRMFVGSGDAGTRRLSGVVEVVDGGSNRSKSGVAFMGVLFGSGSATQFVHAQVWNPLGSGKRLIFKRISALCNGTTTPIDFGLVSEQLGASTGSNSTVNKLSGGVASIAIPIFEARLALITMTNAYTTVPLANNEIIFTPGEPIVVMPGFGLIVRASTLGVQMFVNADYFEDTI